MRYIILAMLVMVTAVPMWATAVDRTEAEQDAAIDRLNCAVFGEDCPTPTTEPEPTATPVPTGWHAPTDHEHGDAPPQWVLDSGHPPFTQTREGHTGYKGVYDVSPGGAESYLIAHIISTHMARMHGDHDYQLWIRDPESGAVLYREGILCFGPAADGCTGQPPLRTSDTGERPIILSVNDGGCETWYSRPGDPAVIVDVGWTICGRNETFDGRVLGNGTFRTMDWIVLCNRLPFSSGLRDNCRVEFGVNRLSFLVSSMSYDAPGVVEPN